MKYLFASILFAWMLTSCEGVSLTPEVEIEVEETENDLEVQITPVTYGPWTLDDFDGIEWDFGDGSTPSGLTAPKHQYDTNGRYTILLTLSYSGSYGEGKYAQVTEIYVNKQRKFDLGQHPYTPFLISAENLIEFCDLSGERPRPAMVGPLDSVWNYGVAPFVDECPNICLNFPNNNVPSEWAVGIFKDRSSFFLEQEGRIQINRDQLVWQLNSGVLQGWNGSGNNIHVDFKKGTFLEDGLPSPTKNSLEAGKCYYLTAWAWLDNLKIYAASPAYPFCVY